MGSLLNGWFARIAFFKLEAPDLRIFLDWSESGYACQADPAADHMRDFFRPELLPSGVESAAGKADMIAKQCFSLDHGTISLWNKRYNRPLVAWARKERRPLELLQRCQAVRRALLGVVCPTVQQFWGALHPDLVAEARAQLAQLPADEPYVAIHVRGGDKDREYARQGRNGSDHSIAGIAELAARHPAAAGRICVILGDDPIMAKRAQDHARVLLKCRAFVMRAPLLNETTQGHVQEAFNSAPLEKRCQLSRAFLVDLSIMADATFLVANLGSNVANLAFWLRSCVAHHDLDSLVDADGVLDWQLWL